MRNKTATLLALLVMLALASSCAKAPDDTTIANDIKAKMYSDPELRAANLEVLVKNGEVTLSGTVPNSETHLKAYKLAAAVAGAAKINDQMKVQAPQVAVTSPPVQAAEKAQAEMPAVPVAPSAQRKEQLRTEPIPSSAKKESPGPAETKKAEPAKLDQPVASQPAVEDQPTPAAGQRLATTSATGRPAVPLEPRSIVIPVGTPISVRMVDSVDSLVNRAGESFRATLEAPITVESTEVVPALTEISVKLATVQSAGRMTGRSELELSLEKMVLDGKSYPLSSTSYEVAGKSRGKDTATKVGIGAGIGAAIGAIAGGGKGAAIGAAVGAGGGTAIQIATRGQQVKVPSETLLEFKLEAPVSVTYTPAKKQPKS